MIINPEAPREERAQRRRRLTTGSSEFREDRVDLPKEKGKMTLKTFLTIVALSASASSAALAGEDCRQYPVGPARLSCASRNHPGFAAKQKRCQEQGQQMGLSEGRAGGLRPFVAACMQRER